jgi:hypothetical protein
MKMWISPTAAKIEVTAQDKCYKIVIKVGPIEECQVLIDRVSLFVS